MKLPPHLQPYEQKARKAIAAGSIRDIEFSGPTYQVQVEDENAQAPVWAFLQLDERGHMRDAFCSCEIHDEKMGCEHLAAAFLYIYHIPPLPLHKRFARSFWNQLANLYAEKWGYAPDGLKFREREGYTLSSRNRLWFQAKGKTVEGKRRLKAILEERRFETEETSLKFSNLSAEEIALWQQGRPSASLQYELSLWCDLAKWLLLMQDHEVSYQLTFSYSAKKIPHTVHVDFRDVSLEFHLQEQDLPLLIPSLATVESPLQVHGFQGEGIAAVTYDEKGKTLTIHPKGEEEENEGSQLPSGIPMGEWLYVPEEGFYLRDVHQLLQHPVLYEEDIPDALDEHGSLMLSLMEGTDLHEETVFLSYHLRFDAEWNLLITAYLFEPEDLTQPYSHLFGDWAYVQGKGFYRIAGKQFDKIETRIAKIDISRFVSQYRGWLNTQEGFRPQLSTLESTLLYEVDEKRGLRFSSHIADFEEEAVDFDHWLYVSERGFYQKTSRFGGLSWRVGEWISPFEIPNFIRHNRQELSHVGGFFSSRCPVEKVGLKVELHEDESVQLTPEYVIEPEYRGAPLLFFEDFVFTPGEGFHDIPVDPRLPPRFRQEVMIPPSYLQSFAEFELESLRPVITSIDKRMQKPQEARLVALSLEQEEGQPLHTKLSIQSEKGSVDAQTLWKAFHAKQRFVFTEAGLLDLHQDRFTWLRWLPADRLNKKRHTLELTALDLLKLQAFDQIDPPSQRGEKALSIRKQLEIAATFVVPEEPDLQGLQSQLRPYQQAGLRWLWFLYHQQLSGLLCDDMGLGKTHQAMALFQAVKNFWISAGRDQTPCHFLVVCPTSVIYHWQEKLHLFLPNMRVCTFYGLQRSLDRFHEDYDILLTSYGVLRREKERFKSMAFEIAVFDEIQLAKNPHSLLHGALLLVKAMMRMGMTGTPIENHLGELKSLFDIVLPSYMPGDTDYREFFVRPIEKEGNDRRRELLSRFVKPFVLRRKKEEVLTDLPEKIEEISYSALLPQQSELYHQVLQGARTTLMHQIENEKMPIPYVHVFALLTRLKRICDHPAIFHGDIENYKKYQSGKWDLFVELLSEARESGQKVVVFSQYLAQLDIIELYLTENKIGFASLRGATVKRGEEVRRFQEDPACEVFVASLQAGGLGIDLTSASVVIHYDRWWNAARENQATDRVHRLGQTRGVQVFKLVTRGTFEERIDAMIARKARRMEEIVVAEDQDVLKQLDRQEILELLRDIEWHEEDQPERILDME